MEVRRIAESLGLTFEGDGERALEGVAEFDAAGVSDLAFVGNRKAAEQAPASAAGCLIVPMEYPNAVQRTVIRSRHPRTDFARAIRLFHPVPRRLEGIHPTAKVAYDAIVAESASISADVVIGSGCVVGEGTYLAPGVVVGDFVRIGSGCTIHPNVTIYDEVEVGDRVVLHAGCVLGADGFGYVMKRPLRAVPTSGRVVIEDDELGVNTTVDRAARSHSDRRAPKSTILSYRHNAALRHVVIVARPVCRVGLPSRITP